MITFMINRYWGMEQLNKHLTALPTYRILTYSSNKKRNVRKKVLTIKIHNVKMKVL